MNQKRKYPNRYMKLYPKASKHAPSNLQLILKQWGTGTKYYLKLRYKPCQNPTAVMGL